MAEAKEELDKIDLGNVNCVVCKMDVYEMHKGMPVHPHCYQGNEAELNKIREKVERGLMLV